MMARATLFLACLASRVAGQAKEPSQYDGDVAALCTSGDVRVTNGTFTLLQTGPTTVTVSVPASAAAANAVWISDAYGTVLDYTGSPTGTDIFTMPEGINDVKAHAAMGCMRVSDPTTFLTWQGLVDTFQSGNYDGFGGGGWSQSQIEEANLTLSADYATRTASFSLTNATGIPFMYFKSSSGSILSYAETTSGSSFTATISDWETAIFGCAPMGDTMQCQEADLSSQIIASLKATNPSSDVTAIPAMFISETTLSVSVPTGATDVCSSAASYILMTESAFTLDSSLLVALSTTTCDFTSAACSLQVSVLCGTTMRSGTIDLTGAYSSFLASAPGTFGVTAFEDDVARGCEGGHTEGAIWTNDDDESCECINTIPECGPAPDGRPHLTVAEAGGIAASCFVALLIIAVMGFYMCHKMKMKTTGDVPAKPTGAAVELPAAGGDTGPAAGVTTDAV